MQYVKGMVYVSSDVGSSCYYIGDMLGTQNTAWKP